MYKLTKFFLFSFFVILFISSAEGAAGPFQYFQVVNDDSNSPATSSAATDSKPRSEKIYRSNIPEHRRDFHTLRDLSRTTPEALTIVSLVDNLSEGVADERQTCSNFGLKFMSYEIYIHEHVPSGSLKRFIDEIMAIDGPILIHCQHGKDRTGLVIGLIRVLHQGWKPEDAFREMLKYGYNPRYTNLNRAFETLTKWKIPWQLKYWGIAVRVCSDLLTGR